LNTLKEQYNLISGSREVLLGYCGTLKPGDLTKGIESFNKSSVMYMLLHIANTYLFWLKRFAADQEFEYFTEEKIKDIEGVKSAFDEVNIAVNGFLDSQSNRSTLIEGEIFWLKKNMTYSVLELFTHVITHEFHHKGQVMTMTRLLGYSPPDADIIRF
jgi:uncharacterized damage-inducible protein DinB